MRVIDRFSRVRTGESRLFGGEGAGVPWSCLPQISLAVLDLASQGVGEEGDRNVDTWVRVRGSLDFKKT